MHKCRFDNFSSLAKILADKISFEALWRKKMSQGLPNPVENWDILKKDI